MAARNKAGDMERREPGTPPQQHAKTEKGRGGAWETMWSTGQEPLEAGRKSADRRGRRAGLDEDAGKGDLKSQGKEERREKGRDGRRKTTAARHSPGQAPG